MQLRQCQVRQAAAADERRRVLQQREAERDARLAKARAARQEYLTARREAAEVNTLQLLPHWCLRSAQRLNAVRCGVVAGRCKHSAGTYTNVRTSQAIHTVFHTVLHEYVRSKHCGSTVCILSC
jgi:hypothetical protein